ncbi:hypothetical protein L5515_000461 [Caenorhabditis briggsae]|uniref:Uncharacterized protein n=1 Tax=Caenorhabditis briggsae TaxID=6238 RepID=A0AAE9DYG4_CAEBR|nr:hypothetical protein L5515_000461 [Caenorhabditis briggsae]
MRRLIPILIFVLLAIPSEGAKCRGRYMEMRGGDGFVTRGGCRGLDSQIQEEYWTTVGFDGALRDGRTTDDFLVFPESENNGHRQRNSFVGYWDMFENADPITRSKYGENVHYEAFGHAFIKPDGKVCGWFVGSEKEVVEVCGGFRVLSRSRYNPHQPIPFEHKIGKYEVNGDEVIFGDADAKNKKFNGVSVSNEEKVQVEEPSDFHRKVWLLRKKNQQQRQDTRIPLNIVTEPKRREDLDIYKDPHHEERILNWRMYPYYDQYGRPSGSQVDASRPAYDSSGRRIPFSASNQYDQYARNQQLQDSGNSGNSGSSGNSNQISNNYQYYDSQQQPPRNHPGYEEWLRNQYRIRGIIPKGYENYFASNRRNDEGSYGRENENGREHQFGQSGSIGSGVRVVGGNGNGNSEANSQNQYEQSAYVLQPASSGSSSDANNNVVYEGQNSGSQNSDDGSTNYFVNGGDPVDASATQIKVDKGENKQFKVPGGEEDSDDSKNVVIPKKEHVRFIPYQPPVVIRDKKGNIYERRVENGKVHYIDASGNEVKIDNSKIDQKIERVLENRRRQEEASLRLLIENSGDSADESDPITAAETGRQG